MKKIDSILILLSSFFSCNLKRKNAGSGIIIVFSGVIGDAIVYAQCITRMAAYYSTFTDNIRIIVKPEVYELYRVVFKDIHLFQAFDLHRYVTDYTFFKEKNKELRKANYSKCIVPSPSVSADLLAMNICADEKITYYDKTIDKSRMLYKIIRIKAYNSIVNLLFSDKIIEKASQFANYICDQNNKTGIKQFHVVPHSKNKKYIMVFPICSTSERNWEQQKFRVVIDYLINKDFYVIVSYKYTDTEQVSHLKNVYSDSDEVRIENSLSIQELLSYIQGSSLVIACDSAPNHLAAAMGVKNICILSGRDDGQMMPYRSNGNLTGYDPICVGSKHMDCFGCNLGRGKLGKGNRECMKRIKQGKSASCISSIEPEQVIAAIADILESED